MTEMQLNYLRQIETERANRREEELRSEQNRIAAARQADDHRISQAQIDKLVADTQKAYAEALNKASGSQFYKTLVQDNAPLTWDPATWPEGLADAFADAPTALGQILMELTGLSKLFGGAG